MAVQVGCTEAGCADSSLDSPPSPCPGSGLTPTNRPAWSGCAGPKPAISLRHGCKLHRLATPYPRQDRIENGKGRRSAGSGRTGHPAGIAAITEGHSPAKASVSVGRCGGACDGARPRRKYEGPLLAREYADTAPSKAHAHSID